MEGGCYWTTKPGEDQINSISTGLFAELSVRLALIEKNLLDWMKDHFSVFQRKKTYIEEYIEAARSSLGWILRCRYRPEEGIVLDGVLLKDQTANNWTFTYTTGVTTGVCALLYKALKQDDYLVLGIHMARKSMARSEWVNENGVLTEPGAYGKGTHNPAVNNDAVGFKSVLMRQLGVLYQVISDMRTPNADAQETACVIESFVNVNFQRLQAHDTNAEGQYGPWWDGPFEMPTSHSQMAVLDVMALIRLVDSQRGNCPQLSCRSEADKDSKTASRPS